MAVIFRAKEEVNMITGSAATNFIPSVSAPVNRIIPSSLVDGPGNRVAIFLQGCGFACKYCHNPETIHLCCHCGTCVGVCPTHALTAEEGTVRWDPALCCGCDQCIQACPHSSSPKTRCMTPNQVLEEIKKPLAFARGITTSGGECTLHSHFLAQLFAKVHELGKSAFIDTNGQVPLRDLPWLMEETDKAMLDIKSMDEKEHRMLTGSSMDLVLDNLDYLLEEDKLFEIRTVVIPGYLDNAHTVDAASRIIARVPSVRYKLIRFRNWGVRGELADQVSPSMDLMETLACIARSNGVEDIVII